ncbi:MAG TPA: hypothetical protein VHB50_16345, partial [Bryobacteraceae bacterium]|nr:hypothetical protein [Bryobacteraceae bacterium]
TVPVVVTTTAGAATTTVTLNRFAPSLSLIDVSANGLGYVAGIILRPNGSGAYGGGAYDILGPTGNLLGFRTVAANPGDVVELFGVGFGPATPAVPAGQPFSGAARIDNDLTLSINSVNVHPDFVGLSSSGLYQVNLTVPTGLGEGLVPIEASVGGMRTQPKVVFPLGLTTIPISSGPVGTGGIGGGGTGGSFGGGSSGFGGGSGGSFGGGSGGGSDAVHPPGHHKAPWRPRLRFPPK